MIFTAAELGLYTISMVFVKTKNLKDIAGWCLLCKLKKKYSIIKEIGLIEKSKNRVLEGIGLIEKSKNRVLEFSQKKKFNGFIFSPHES